RMPGILLQDRPMFGPHRFRMSEYVLLNDSVAVPIDVLRLEASASPGQTVELGFISMSLLRSQRLAFEQRRPPGGIDDDFELVDGEDPRCFSCRQRRRSCRAGHQHPGVHEEMEAWNGLPYRSEEHTSELQSHLKLVCRLLLHKTKT